MKDIHAVVIALGLFGYAFYLYTTGDVQHAVTAVLAGLAALGVLYAEPKSSVL